MRVTWQIKSKVNRDHNIKLCRAFGAPSGDLAAMVTQAPPPLSRPHLLPLLQPHEPSGKIFCCFQMRILEINCAVVHLWCYFMQARPNQTSVDAYYATDNWAEGQTAQFGQLLRQLRLISTPTGNFLEFHHLCLEMPTTTSDRSTCMSSACFETRWNWNRNSLLESNDLRLSNTVTCFCWWNSARDAAADFSA